MPTEASQTAIRRPAILGYAVAVLAVGTAAAGLAMMESRWQAAGHVSILLIAVILTTRIAGARSGLVASALALPALAYLLLHLTHPLADSALYLVQFISLAVVSCYVVWLTATERARADSLRSALGLVELSNEALGLENLERKRAEEELRASEGTFRALAQNVPGAIFICQGGRVGYANAAAAALTGYSTSELCGRGFWDSAAPESRAMILARQAAHQRGEPAPPRFELKILTKAGEERWLDFTEANFAFEGKPAELAIALDITERKSAEDALHDSADRLKHLAARLLTLQEEERRHLSRELHDEFGQLLATAALHLQAAKSAAGPAAQSSINESMRLLQRAGTHVRGLALELRPVMLETAGLDATLRWLAEQYEERTGIVSEIIGHVSEVSGEVAIACFRVVQEALTNVVRHAAARHAWIELSQSEGLRKLVIRDDGKGFDVSRTLERAAGAGNLGLVGMRERVEILGGSVAIESRPGYGTRIDVSLPLAELTAAPASRTAR